MKLLIVTALPVMFVLTGCLPMGDCTHNFIYEGAIVTNDTLHKDSLAIRFDNLGDIIFRMDDKRRTDKSFADRNGKYKVSGHFFAACGSDKDAFSDKDSLSYEIFYRRQLIKNGKFCINKLIRQYSDSAHLTIINIPLIKTE